MEEQIKFSPQTQILFSEVKQEINGWLRITNEIQQQVATQFGYKDLLSNLLAVNQMQRAQYLYPNDPDFIKYSVYIRHNRAQPGKYQLGDKIPNIKLVDMNLETITLDNILITEKPTIIIASSYT